MNGGGLSEIDRRTLELLSTPAVLLMSLWLLTPAVWAAIGFDLALALAGFAATRLLIPSDRGGGEGGGGSPGRLCSAALRWIGPALLVVGVASLGFGLLCLPPGDLKRQAIVMLTASTGLWGLVPGVDAPAHSDDLWLHVWIVGVAAQLALGWSLVVAGAKALGKRGLLRSLAVIGLLAALALDLWLTGEGRGRQALLLAPARAAPFLAGALVALSPLRSPEAWAAFLRRRAGASLARVGRIAVPFWLWLWPVWQGVRLITARSPTALEVTVILVAAVGLALATTALMSASSFRRRVHPGAAVAILALAAASVVALDGLPGRASPAVRSEETAAGRTPPLQAACNVENDRLPPAASCTVRAAASADVILWGNSHASHLSPAVLDWARTNGLSVRQATKSGCPPLLGDDAGQADRDCMRFNRAAATEWGRMKPDVILLGAGWTVVAQTGPGDAAGRLDALMDALEHTVVELRREVGPEARIVLLGTTPDYDRSPAACHARRAFVGLSTRRCDLRTPANAALAARADERLARIAAGRPAVSLFRPWTALCSGSLCRTRGPEGPWYADRLHLTEAGGRAQAGALSALLAGAGAAERGRSSPGGGERVTGRSRVISPPGSPERP